LQICESLENRCDDESFKTLNYVKTGTALRLKSNIIITSMISTVIIFEIPAFKTFHLQLVGTFIIHLHKIQHIHNYHVSSVIPVKLKTRPKLDTATILLYSGVKSKSKAVPLHAMVALGGRGGIAPTHS
jgi:hypothetical protein